MKKEYSQVKIEFVELLAEDIIVTSAIPENVGFWPENW